MGVVVLWTCGVLLSVVECCGVLWGVAVLWSVVVL